MDWDDFDYDPMGIIFGSSDEDEPKNRLPVRSYYMDRNNSGAHTTVFEQLAKEDPELFYSYTRMSLGDFEELLSLVAPIIQKQTVIQEPMSPSLRLALTLR